MEEHNNPKKKGPNLRSVVLYVLLGLVLVALVGSQLVNFGPQEEIDELITSDFVTAVNDGRVDEVTYHAASATLDGTYYKDEAAKEAGELSSFKSTYTGDDMLQELMAAHPETKYNEDVTTSGWITTLLTTLLPLLLIFGVLIFFMSQVSGANNKQMQFGKTKAKKVSEETPKVRFSDVAGIDEAVEELEEIKDFLSNPAKYQAMGAKIPRGVLLVGPPGTGKTLLARAVAGEAGVPFFSISGSDFVEMFVGVGASRVRDLFAQAKEAAPAIIFIDQIVVDRPDLKGREQILKVHCEGKPMASDVDLAALASLTSGFTGADLANLLNESALLAARRNKSLITNDEVTESMERVVAGPERKGRIMTDKEKATIAYHESGHALVGHLLNHTDPIHKISIIARGQALGYTLSIPSEDRFLQSKSEMIDNLAMFLGGRVAEEIMNNGDVTTGASNDLERATKMAKAMVTRYGMSDILGHQVYGEPNQEVFLGRDFGSTPDYGQETANTIDEEVARLMTTAHDTAYSILSENRDQLELMAQVLLERETVEGRAVEALLDNTWDEYVEWEKTHPSEAEQDKKNIVTAAQNVGAPHELMDPRDASDAPAPVSPPAPDSDDGGR